MSSFNHLTVNRCVADMSAANGSNFISGTLSSDTRMAGYRLLEAYGIPMAKLEPVSDADLCTVYATARKDTAKGAAVAARIGNKYARNPLLDPVPVPDTPPAAIPSPAAVPADMAEALRILRDNVTTQCRNLSDDVRSALDSYSGALPGIVAAELARLAPTRVEVKLPDAPPVDIGLSHYCTPRVIRYLAAGNHVYLHGPAGSGKTSMAKQAAKALGVDFYFMAKVESEYLLLGYRNPHDGTVVRSQFRDAYEYGGVFLFDELDASNAGAIVAMNAALGNKMCPFPDGIVEMHPNFKCIGAGNTKLNGASRQYSGRVAMDGASVDRFAFIEFPYDEKLERAIASDAQWCLYVQAVRAAVQERGLIHLVTPRATIEGCALIACGEPREEVAEAWIWKGLDPETVRQLKAAVSVPMYPVAQAQAA